MGWLIVASVEVVKLALPPASVPVPSVVPPSWKVTVPVAVPAPGAFAVTVAVSVTDCPKTLGAAELITAVAVASGFTVCGTAADVLPVKSASPLYAAVME